MIHQPLINGHFQDQTTNLEIEAAEMERIRDMLNNILSEATGKSIEDIEKDTDRDYFMTAEEALNYGIVDRILTKHE